MEKIIKFDEYVNEGFHDEIEKEILKNNTIKSKEIGLENDDISSEEMVNFCISALEQFGNEIEIQNVYEFILNELKEIDIDESDVVY